MTTHASLYDFLQTCPNEKAAARFFERQRWPKGVRCPLCGSKNIARNIARVKNANPMPFRCRTCRKHFSVRTGTIKEKSKLGLHKWLMTMYLLHSSRKGVSSVQLAKMIGTTQRTAWFLCHRIRKAMESEGGLLGGVVEVDETYIGGKEKTSTPKNACGWEAERRASNPSSACAIETAKSAHIPSNLSARKRCRIP